MHIHKYYHFICLITNFILLQRRKKFCHLMIMDTTRDYHTKQLQSDYERKISYESSHPGILGFIEMYKIMDTHIMRVVRSCLG